MFQLFPFATLLILLIPNIVFANEMNAKVMLCHQASQMIVEVEESHYGPGSDAPIGCDVLSKVEGIKFTGRGRPSVESTNFEPPGNLANSFADSQNDPNFTFERMDYGRQVAYKAFTLQCPMGNLFVIANDHRGPGAGPSYLRVCRQGRVRYFQSSKVVQGVYKPHDLRLEEFLKNELDVSI